MGPDNNLPARTNARGGRKTGKILLSVLIPRGASKSPFRYLYQIDQSGNNLTPLLADSTFPVYNAKWSPDGNSIALGSDSGIYILREGNRKRITALTYELDGVFGYGGTNPCWSPNGSEIVFNRHTGPEIGWSYGIFIIGADGSNERPLRDSVMYYSDWLRGWNWRTNEVYMDEQDWPHMPSNATGRTVVIGEDSHSMTIYGFGDPKMNNSLLSTRGKFITFSGPSSSTGAQALFIMDRATGQPSRFFSDYGVQQAVGWNSTDDTLLVNAHKPSAYGFYGYVGFVPKATGQFKEIPLFPGANVYIEALDWH